MCYSVTCCLDNPVKKILNKITRLFLQISKVFFRVIVGRSQAAGMKHDVLFLICGWATAPNGLSWLFIVWAKVAVWTCTKAACCQGILCTMITYCNPPGFLNHPWPPISFLLYHCNFLLYHCNIDLVTSPQVRLEFPD